MTGRNLMEWEDYLAFGLAVGLVIIAVVFDYFQSE